MANNMTAYLAKALLDHITGVMVYSPPLALYASLHLSAPVEGGSSNEVAQPSYSRVAVDWTVSAGEPATASNDVAVLFPVAGEVWGLITHGGVYDAVIGGNLLFFGPLTAGVSIDTDDRFNYPIGNLTMALT